MRRKIVSIITFCQIKKNVRINFRKETKANLRGWFLGASSLSIGLLFVKLIFPIFLLIYLSFGYSADTELVYYLMNLLKVKQY